MSFDDVQAAQTLDPNSANRIDHLCDQFQAAWDSGPPPRIEEFVSSIDAHWQSRLEAGVRRAERFRPSRSSMS